jgi:hypothetical protein
VLDAAYKRLAQNGMCSAWPHPSKCIFSTALNQLPFVLELDEDRFFLYKTIQSYKKHQNTKGHIKIVENQVASLDMAAKERVLKFTVMQNRNPNISEEEFNSYWTRKHAAVAAAWLQRNGILGYTQVSLDWMVVT